MKKRVSLFLFLVAFLSVATSFCKITVNCSTTKQDDNTKNISLQFNLGKKDFVLKESIDLSVDHPGITLSEWQADIQAIERFEPTFKDTKQLFTKNFKLSLQAHSKKPFAQTDDPHLYVSFYSGAKKQTIQKLFPLKKEKKIEPILTEQMDEVEEIQQTLQKTKPTKPLSFSQKVSNAVADTESLWLRLFLVLLLGLLMSLTPCIYPMVPITVGILQSQGSKSVAYNFLQALCYTLGIATTFATLGLTAAFTGQLFGSLMGNPFVIIFLALFMAYLGLAMFGFYEMYTPRSLSSGGDASKAKKSLLSIFLFGAISGTVASPCLSPGLILLLSIVTSLGSKLLGFALLFSFGVGLSIPLLVIGTFSGSLNVLPRAGMWMVEVKKLFGFLLFGMSFYFLKNILPLSILFGLMTIFFLLASGFYFYKIAKNDSKFTKLFKNVIAIICMVLAVLLGFKTYQEIAFTKIEKNKNWCTDDKVALQIAQQEKKKLFIDIGAEFCTICKAIDNGLLADPSVQEAMNKFVNLKIDGSDCPKHVLEGIVQKYEVVGFPTYLLIDPDTGDLLARWGSELYDLSPQEFIKLIEKY